MIDSNWLNAGCGRKTAHIFPHPASAFPAASFHHSLSQSTAPRNFVTATLDSVLTE
ncbi:hypothetical protein GOA63_25405 [Sinorhizobium meliloti]|nr:hypothetical protein [Sinorhizobium meliloti]MDW9482637.1 hypothetical protein [Sinorhizobium meliloti]MDW9514261.1 hypothetical protein [Sinorhizobium meliloti]MDW9595529.1 hypothetical protein [Sinorhizobium meliloti]MDX0189245.1 hypothetical protein [Sinorhizobium meliloti]